MWALEKVEKTEDLDEYWVLVKVDEAGPKPFGAFFNKTIADRILAFLNNKWIQSR